MATTKATTLAHTLGGISSDISTAEINRLDGVTGDIQTQIDTLAPKASPTFTGTITAPNDSISGDAVSGGTIGAGTFNGTIGTNYQVPRKIYPFYHRQYAEGLGADLTEVLSYQFGSAVGTNSFYTLSCSLWINNEDQSNSERGDFTACAYLQNGDASKKYRFGFYKNNAGNDNFRLTNNMATVAAGFVLSDTDGGIYGENAWNGSYWAYSDVIGTASATNSELTSPSASTFSSSEALTLKVFLGSAGGGVNYNVSQDSGNRTSRNFSFYCIKEYSSLG